MRRTHINNTILYLYNALLGTTFKHYTILTCNAQLYIYYTYTIIYTGKKLASQTILCINYLYQQNRLTLNEKKTLIHDIIINNSEDSFSQVEVAFSLLIGPGLPEELLSYLPDTDDDGEEEDEDGMYTIHLAIVIIIIYID